MITLLRWLGEKLFYTRDIHYELRPTSDSVELTRQLVVCWGGLSAILMTVGWVGIDFLKTPWFSKEWYHSLVMIRTNHFSFYTSCVYAFLVMAIYHRYSNNHDREFYIKILTLGRLMVYGLVVSELLLKWTGYDKGLGVLIARGMIIVLFYYAIPVTTNPSLYKIEAIWFLLYRGAMWWVYSPHNIGLVSRLELSLNRMLDPLVRMTQYLNEGVTLISYKLSWYSCDLLFLMMVVWLMRKRGAYHVDR